MDCTWNHGRRDLLATLWTAGALATASLLPQSAHAAILLGQQTVLSGRDSNSAGTAEAFRTTAGVTGTVTSLTVFVDAGSGATALVAGIYTDRGGTPGALLGQGSLSRPVAGAWNSVTIPGAAVTAGTVYWIALLGPSGSGTLQFRDSEPRGARSETSRASNLTTLPATWLTGSVWTGSPAAAYGSSSVSLAAIAVAPASATAVVGAAQSFTATGTYSDGSTANVTSSATWSSSSPAVATVSASGVATALAVGTTTISAAIGSISGTASLTVNQPSLTITTASLPGGTQLVPYSASLAASGGTPPYTWSNPPGLPPGLSVDPFTGAIGGTPTSTGFYSFQAQVTDSAPVTTSKTLSITVLSPPPPPAGDWLTYGHDPQRSGNAAGETAITTANVGTLGLQWSAGVDGKITAQPLFVSAATVLGQTHDVIVAATASNTLYALEAGTGTPLWTRHFASPNGAGAIPGGFGIAGTPVIDPTTNRIYAVTDDGLLRTVSLADGTDAAASLAVVTADTTTNFVWGGLNLVGGSLYLVTASDGNDSNPWWGRILQISLSGGAPVVSGLFKVVPSVVAPNGGGGIWGYGGASVDPATGRVFVATGADSLPWGSGVPEGYTPYAGRMVALAANLGYSATTAPLGAPLGSWEPPHPPCRGSPGVCDMDFGATPIVFQPTGCPLLVAAVNKDGHLYVLRANDLAASGAPLQAIALNDPFDGPGAGGLTGIPAFWPGGNMLFVTAGGPGINGIKAGVVGLTVSPAPSCTLSPTWSVSLAAALDQPPSPPTVANGIVFVGSGLNGAVHAFDAVTGTELWNSGTAIAGGATFGAPSVAAGTLFVASWNGFGTADAGTVRAFALGAAPPPPPPSTLLGDQNVEPTLDDNALGSAEAFRTSATASGTVTKLSIYIDGSSTAATLVAGIYADAAGHPGALIAQGQTSAITAGAWNTITLPGATVNSGATYWIAILATQSGLLRFRDGSGGCTSETSAQGNLTALPATWATGSVWPSCPLSAYGTQ
jgi:hypothetical protein